MQNEPQRSEGELALPKFSADDAVSVADDAVREWLAIDAALSPIIGTRGVSALYRRSVTVTRSKHPVFGGVHESEPGTAPFQSLQDALAQISSLDAAAANTALVDTFTELLGQLIGVQLTAQLLGRTDESTPGSTRRNGDRP